MRVSSIVAVALTALTANTLFIPESARGLSLPEGTFGPRHVNFIDLERRKGGGGGGKGGSSGGEGSMCLFLETIC